MNSEFDVKSHPPVPFQAWARLADSVPPVGFIDVCLRGCGQVLLQNNPLTGLFFLAAIIWAAHVESNPGVAIGAVAATAIATGTAYLFKMDKESLRSGLYGYSATLMGIGLPTFLSSSPYLWLCLVFGAILCPIFTLVLAKILKTWQGAALTAPFVFVTWFIMLGANNFSHLHSSVLPAPMLPHPLNASSLGGALSVTDFISAGLYGASEVFLLPSMISGALILIGLAVSSGWVLGFGIIGTLLPLAVGQFLGADPSLLHAGLYSFSGVLTAVAIGHTFNQPSWRVLIYTVICVVFTVFVQGALAAILSPYGLPVLTMPFVMASWLFLVADDQLMPKHHRL
ncbi:urea transporter [Trinickia mobilis]|uniref:urea transporter n=1 Tax=Trinickia mobilis TaxID=2816356 RepID=UPI001A9000EB|nr:urea transporter [Trinickia mobilis]